MNFAQLPEFTALILRSYQYNSGTDVTHFESGKCWIKSFVQHQMLTWMLVNDVPVVTVVVKPQLLIKSLPNEEKQGRK